MEESTVFQKSFGKTLQEKNFTSLFSCSTRRVNGTEEEVKERKSEGEKKVAGKMERKEKYIYEKFN